MNILIKDYSVETPSNGSKFISYLVVCKYKSIQWTVKKRFSQFYALNKAVIFFKASFLRKKKLLKKYGNKEEFKKIEKFPQKIIFGNMKVGNINKRKEKLQNYLHDIMHCPLTNVSKEVANFLEITDNVNEKIDKFTVAQKKSEVESYKALYDYSGKDEEELTFNKGDTLVVIEKHDSGWWFGYKRGTEKIQGFFPAAFTNGALPEITEDETSTLQTLKSEEEDIGEESIEDSDEEMFEISPTPKIPKKGSFSVKLSFKQLPKNPNIMDPVAVTYKIIYDFNANEESDGEISVRKEDLCEKIKTNEKWTYIFHLPSKKYGWVPEDFISRDSTQKKKSLKK